MSVHTDKTVGFKAQTLTFFFGEEGAEKTNAPYMTLIPSNKETSLHIASFDFNLFAWSMTNILKEAFDEYGDYRLTYSQWNKILQEAKKITNFETFDELFDYMISMTPNGLCHMNYQGAEFWANKSSYIIQLEDMEKWSQLTMSPDDEMSIYGF